MTNEEAKQEINKLDLEYQEWCVTAFFLPKSADELLVDLITMRDIYTDRIKWLKDWIQRYENARHIEDNT